MTNSSDIARLAINNAHLIGGAWVPGDGDTIAVLDPATATEIGRIPRGGAFEVDQAVAAATAALPVWRDMNPTERAVILRRWGDLCLAEAETIQKLECLEVGRIYVAPSIVGQRLIYRAGQTDKLTGTALPVSHPYNLALCVREPYGVCGVIVPWNVPTDLMINDVAPALAAGNTVIVKPPEDAPFAIQHVLSLARAAGVPDGVVNIVNGFGAEAGAALAGHPGIQHMSFTGSPETGKRIMESCARNLTPLRLELGGKSPQIVFEDADLEKALPALLRGIVNNAGQVCSAGSRLLVANPIREKLARLLAGRMDALRLGAWDSGADIGPLINGKQRERVLGYVRLGAEQGGRLMTRTAVDAGLPEAGFFVRPALFDAVTHDMAIAREEIFGPVLSVVGFDDPEEALRIANGTRYGLVASIWTERTTRAIQMAKRVEAGLVYINTYAFNDAIGAPFGGIRDSGFGRSMGIDAIDEYTRSKTIIMNAQGTL
ncbi:MAG TPA: aldehyde dehydrogenase family protein [Paenirhodobacter sp.]